MQLLVMLGGHVQDPALLFYARSPSRVNVDFSIESGCGEITGWRPS